MKKKNIFDREKAKEKFFNNVIKISNFAQKHDIKILVENNVVSQKNLKNFGFNPFLISCPSEIKEFLTYIDTKKVNMLIDVAHLKVSANSLNFKVDDFFNSCNGRIGGYHLSENDGLSDTNEKFNQNSWFWQYIDKKIKYLTIEVYNLETHALKQLRDLVEKKIS